MLCNSFRKGLRDGIPIGLGYLSVSLTFGMTAVAQGLPVWAAILISMTNLTSAGQFAGLSVMVANASMLEMALTQLVINLRYAIMSLSLSQKFAPRVRLRHRFAIAFFNTDEVFAVASAQAGELGERYMFGLGIAPYLGWSLGTVIGAVASSFLPPFLTSALGIAIYGMFLAIIIPPAKKERAVVLVLLIAVGVSCLFRWAPLLRQVSSGFAMILSALVAALIGALVAPVRRDPYAPAETETQNAGGGA